MLITLYLTVSEITMPILKSIGQFMSEIDIPIMIVQLLKGIILESLESIG